MAQTPQNPDVYLTLSEAAKLAPGRPSANAVWRWARRGVRSRAGHRVYLHHIRAGGRVLTRRDWVEDFMTELAEADAEHFRDADADRLPPERQHRKSERDEHERAAERLRQRGLT